MDIECSQAKWNTRNFVAQVIETILKFALSYLHLYSQGGSSICRVCLNVASVPASLEDILLQGISRWTEVIVTLAVSLGQKCQFKFSSMCCAMSCDPCINFLLSEFKVFVTRCQSHCQFLSCCPGTSTWNGQKMLYSLNSTLGHLVDSSRGVRVADRGAYCCRCITKCSEDLWLDHESTQRKKRYRDR